MVEEDEQSAPPAGACASPPRRPALFPRVLLASAGGVLLSLCFPPLSWYWLAWVGLMPLLLALRGLGAQGRRVVGFAFGVGLFGSGMHWLFNLFGFPSVALIAIMAGFVWLFAAFYAVIPDDWPEAVRAALLASAWVGLEFVRSEGWWLKYSWFGLGYSQTPNLPILQLAAALGGYGISYLIVFGNVALYEAVTKRQRTGYITLAAAAMVVFMAYQAGSSRLTRQPNASLAVAVIQDESLDLDTYVAMTERAAEMSPDLIVWPEIAVPYIVEKDDETFQRLALTARMADAALIVGCKTPADTPDKPEAFHNSAMLFSRDGSYLGVYHKNNPVQFVDDGVAGTEAPSFPCQPGRIGMMICYDMDYPSVARRLVENSAGLIAVPTLDAEEWGRVQHLQHAAMTPMRAVETGRFLVRAASSGISQIVDPYGRENLRTGFSPTASTGQAGVVYISTLYVAWGHRFGPLCLALTLSVCAVLLGIHARRRILT